MEESLEAPSVMAAAFEQKPQIEAISKALAKFQAECPIVEKNKFNTYFKASYADLGGVIATIKAHLGANGLAVTQWPLDNGYLITQISHESGQWMRSKWSMRAAKADPQSIGSALKYQRRYALCAALGVGEDDEGDDDGNGASTKTGKDKVLEDIGFLLRTIPATKRADVLKEKGFVEMKEMSQQSEAYLKKVYEALGGDQKMAAVKAQG